MHKLIYCLAILSFKFIGNSSEHMQTRAHKTGLEVDADYLFWASSTGFWDSQVQTPTKSYPTTLSQPSS